MTKLNINEQIHLSRRLGFLLVANIPLLNSLKMLYNGSRSKKERKVLKFISRQVSLGYSLADGFRKSGAFNSFVIYLSEIGETGGGLGRNLGFAADELEKKKRLRQKIQGAMIYPLLISIVSVAITILLIGFVFPKIIPILSGLNGKLPFATRMLISLSDFLKRYGIYLGAVLAVGGVSFSFLFKKIPKFRFAGQSFISRIFFIRDFSVYYQMADFSRTIGLLLESGLTLERGLTILASHAGNELYKSSYRKLKKDILEGKRLSIGMQKIGRRLFPALVEEMVEVGETTGELSKTLVYLSELYENELTEKTKTLSGLLEPALMIFLGLVIGTVALSIIMPIYQITANLHQ